jgi:dipeptidyl aminopeptidase/acylaminoacyl peptidase
MHQRFVTSAVCAAAILAVVMAPAAMAQDAPAYRMPPAPIAQILDTDPAPVPSISPDRETLALLGRSNLPSIAEVAEDDLRLAGYRINPRNNGPANSRTAWLNSLTFQDVATGEQRVVALGEGQRFIAGGWSPDSRFMAFLADAPQGLELWVAEAATGQARRLTDPVVNAAFSTALDWTPDSSAVLARLVPEGRGAAPDVTAAPTGPVIEETTGQAAPNRTYQDLLSTPGDERLFDHYFTSRLSLVPVDGSPARMVGEPGLIAGAAISPDGRHILQTRLKRPYSYNVPARLFPTDVIVTDLSGNLIHQAADLPLRDNVPTPFDSVAEGPRSVQWRADAPATLVWVEAQDGGDSRREAEVRDRVFIQAAPFDAPPQVLIDLNARYAGVDWGRDDLAMVSTRWFNTRHETRWLVDPSNPGQGRLLLERNYQDRYNDPGSPMTRPTPEGFRVMHMTPDGQGVFTTGAGATREGAFPFLGRMDLASGETERLWTSSQTHYETIAGLLDEEGRVLLTRRESLTEPPNLYVRDLDSADPRALTDFPDPAPQLAGATRETIAYTRADGVQLSGTLYLPAGYDKDRDGPLPLLMWAYPAEFTDAAVAGQVVDTGNRFVRPGGSSHLFMLTQGFAILDNPSMPIVGVDGAEPNDTYVEQLVSSAQAAVDAVVERGVADRDRIAVGGHSYGAFMTANLLAHSDLFRAGIARSGAYNRTLTPFGFQAEQRTYWEAPETYNIMSPFMHADRVNEPILLIHGADDSNSGTFPVQTERFYAALKGHGAVARYVVLPAEDHGYRARESVMHTLWEMTDWLNRYVRDAGPAAGGGR